MSVGVADPIPGICRSLCAQVFSAEFTFANGRGLIGRRGEWILKGKKRLLVLGNGDLREDGYPNVNPTNGSISRHAAYPFPGRSQSGVILRHNPKTHRQPTSQAFLPRQDRRYRWQHRPFLTSQDRAHKARLPSSVRRAAPHCSLR